MVNLKNQRNVIDFARAHISAATYHHENQILTQEGFFRFLGGDYQVYQKKASFKHTKDVNMVASAPTNSFLLSFRQCFHETEIESTV